MLQEEADALEDEAHPLHRAVVDHVFVGERDVVPPEGYTSRAGISTPSARTNSITFRCNSIEAEGGRCVLDARKLFEELGVDRLVPCAFAGYVYATLNMYIGEEDARTERDWPLHKRRRLLLKASYTYR